MSCAGRTLFLVATVAWILYNVPTAIDFLNDRDSGHFLAGAMQIQVVGEHPYIDFFTIYGPLCYYVTAIGQILTSNRLVGECLLYTIGLGFTYVAMLLLAHRLTGSRGIALLLTATALIFIPGPIMWIYGLLALPMLMLLAAKAYIWQGSRRGFIILAATVTLSGLYRHDYGIFTLVGALTTVLLTQQGAQRLRLGLSFLSWVFAFAVPWLLTMGFSEHPLNYFEFVGRGTIGTGLGMARPHPLIFWRHESLSMLFFIFFLWPVIGLIASWIRLRQSEPGTEERKLSILAVAVCITACSILATASHRADLGHLLYVVPTSLLSLGAFLRVARLAVPWPWRRAVVPGLALSLALPIILLVGWHELPRFRPVSEVLDALVLMSRPRDSMLEELSERSESRDGAEFFTTLRDCTEPRARILVMPIYAQFYYFTERPFSGKLVTATFGYFSDPDFQRRQIEAMQQHPPSIVLWKRGFLLDSMPERGSDHSHGLVLEYVSRQFEQLPDLRDFSVFVPQTEVGAKVDTKCLYRAASSLREPLAGGGPRSSTASVR